MIKTIIEFEKALRAKNYSYREIREIEDLLDKKVNRKYFSNVDDTDFYKYPMDVLSDYMKDGILDTIPVVVYSHSGRKRIVPKEKFFGMDAGRFLDIIYDDYSKEYDKYSRAHV